MIVGISTVRDEADIIAATVGQMLDQVEHVIVADNNSTDGTREILAELPVTLIDDPEVGYFQSQKMTALAMQAQAMGADWVVPFDADEFWYSPFGRIADVLAELEAVVVTAPIFDHVATAEDPEGPPLERIGWRRREPCPLHKVACRPVLPVTITQGNHGAHYPSQAPAHGELVIRHFPYRSPEQFESKVRNGAAAYAATDLPADVGQHWRDYGRTLEERGPEALAEHFRKWFWSADPTADDLIFDPCLQLSASSPG